MKEKINQKGFIQIPLLIGIIASILVTSGAGYGAFEYNKTSNLVKEASQLSGEEKYSEANDKLEVASNGVLVKTLRIKKQEINNQIEENKKLAEDKSSYDKGLDALNNNNFQEAIDILSVFPENSFYYQKAQTKIEESKRIIVEGKLSVETTAKLAAEAEAKQEAYEKRLKEQELADKEAAERMMNTDNDGDGLTYRRELELGTSDWDTDSDGDGIRDDLDSHPTGEGRLMAQHFEWDYGNKYWTWDYSFPSDRYDYYKNQKRQPHGIFYVTSEDPYIKQIADMLKNKADENNYTKSMFAMTFIQSLGYVGDEVIGYNDYPKFPLETMGEQNGDCEDTSYLAASIINAMNIDCVLVKLPGHMAVAVAFSDNPSGYYYSLSNGRNYYYLETTGKDFNIGDMPPEYHNVSASIVNLSSGESVSVYPQYIKPCYSSDFAGYYYDGSNYYSDSYCNNLVYCLSYQGYYVDPLVVALYWDSSCSQMVVKGCYESKSYPGYFYRSGSAWYYDSACTQMYQSMACTYPSSFSYSCTSESSYTYKKSNCDYYASSQYLKNMAQACYDELPKCRSDINEYQAKLNEYNQCFSRKEY